MPSSAARPLALLLAAVLAAACTPAPDPTPGDPAPDPAEAAVAAALAGLPGFAVPADTTFAWLADYRDDSTYGDASFEPYRVTGDFDGDGTDDLAVLAAGPAEAVGPDPEAPAEHPVRVLVFDGADGFRLAHTEPDAFPLGQVYIAFRDGALALTLAETDFVIELVPDGDGYTARDVSG